MALLTAFLKQECLWRRPTGWTTSGDPILDVGVAIPCRWVRNARRIVDAAGDSSATTIDVYATSALEVGDRLTLGGTTVEVVTLHDYVGFNGGDEGRRVGCR